MKLGDAIKKRKSVRRFSHRKPDWRKILRAIDSVRFAPSAGNNFIMKFILVSEEEKIKEIAQSTQQTFVGSAKYIVVAVSDDSKLTRLYDERGKLYARQQAGAAIQNFLLSLTEQKLVTTWVGYFYEEEIKRALDIPDNLVVEAVFPIGIETKIKTKEKKKRDFENIIYFEEWKNKNMNPEKPISVDAS